MIDLHGKYILVETETFPSSLNPQQRSPTLLLGKVLAIGRGLILEQTNKDDILENVPIELKKAVGLAREIEINSRPAIEVDDLVMFYQHMAASNPTDKNGKQFIIPIEAVTATVQK